MIGTPALWIPFAITILFLGPLSEEFGWRGCAQDRLGARFTPLAGSLVLGVVWALWHLVWMPWFRQPAIWLWRRSSFSWASVSWGRVGQPKGHPLQPLRGESLTRYR